MKVVREDQFSTVVEFSNSEKELVDCLFSMVNSLDQPNWGATDVGLGGPRLDEQKFDVLYENWRRIMANRVSTSVHGADISKGSLAL